MLLLNSFALKQLDGFENRSVIGLIAGKKKWRFYGRLLFQDHGDSTLPCCPSRVLFGQALKLLVPGGLGPTAKF